MNVTYRIRLFTGFVITKRNTTGATCGAGSAYPSGAPEIIPSFWWGSCCLFFSFLCCVMCAIVCLFVFFIFSHGVVSLFQISEFYCPFGIFRPSFIKGSIYYDECKHKNCPLCPKYNVISLNFPSQHIFKIWLYIQMICGYINKNIFQIHTRTETGYVVIVSVCCYGYITRQTNQNSVIIPW